MAYVPFITLAQAKHHLNVTGENDNVDVQLKTDQAIAIVLAHLKSQVVAGWSDGTVAVPGNVQAATLLVLGHLWEHRGDEEVGAPITPAVERLLIGFRDPALA
jgi:hypothetical protein